MKSGAWLLRDYPLRGYPKICIMLCEGSDILTTLVRTLACHFSMQRCQISARLLQLYWAVCGTSHLPLLTNTQSKSRGEGVSTRQESGTIAGHNRGLKKDNLAHISHTLCFVEGGHSLFRKIRCHSTPHSPDAVTSGNL